MTKCDRCEARPGKSQPEDGDAARLFQAAAHSFPPTTHLCTSCVRTLEAMALRAAGPTRASRKRTVSS
jgi:hypothetical protein